MCRFVTPIGRHLFVQVAVIAAKVLAADHRDVEADFPRVGRRRLADRLEPMRRDRRNPVAGVTTMLPFASAIGSFGEGIVDTNRHLQATYTPHTATLVRIADRARSEGRKRMRGANGSGSKS